MTTRAPSAAAWLEEIYDQVLAACPGDPTDPRDGRDEIQSVCLAHAANADTSGRTYNTNEKETTP